MNYRGKKHQYEYGKSKRRRLCELQMSGSIFQRLAHMSENLEANRFDNSYFNNNGYHSGTRVRFTVALQCGSFLVHVYNFSQRLRGLA